MQIVQFAGREARQAVGKGLKVLEEVKGEILDHLEGKREVEDEVEREMVITSPWTVRVSDQLLDNDRVDGKDDMGPDLIVNLS